MLILLPYLEGTLPFLRSTTVRHQANDLESFSADSLSTPAHDRNLHRHGLAMGLAL
jgi:hypothetical protein